MERALEVLGMEMISHFLKDTVNSKVPNIHQILKEQTITIKIEMISTKEISSIHCYFVLCNF
jgi:hypothetical protein